MRTFVAFTLPDNVAVQIAEWAVANKPEGVFLEPITNLHMTLAFLGDTPEELVGPINNILSGLDPSSVQISGPIRYEEQARLAFLTYEEVGGSEVWEQLNAQLKMLTGYEPQFKPWLPHTTIWRFAPDHKPNVNPPLPQLSFTPTAVTLYQSVRNEGGGATYQKVSHRHGSDQPQVGETWQFDEAGDNPFAIMEVIGTNAFGGVRYRLGDGTISAMPRRDWLNYVQQGVLRRVAPQMDFDVFPDTLPWGDAEQNYYRTANIFDPVEQNLDQRMFNGIEPRHAVQKFITTLYFRALQHQLGVVGFEWADLYLTGSLTTYQYSDTSDADISVFPNYDKIWKSLGLDPREARKELIDMSITHLDGTFLPGTSHPLQFFVVPPGIYPHDLYKPGLRSAFDLQDKHWFVEPERSRSHVVQEDMPQEFQRAADIAEKMTIMLDDHNYDAAKELWHTVHAKRQLDQRAGLGDYCEGNIVYKWLLHEGLFDRIRNELHEYIAKTAIWPDPEESSYYYGAVDHLWDERVTTKVIYDWDEDRIVLGTQATLPDLNSSSKIVGEYADGKVSLFEADKQWINPTYFRRLWHASYPDRELKDVFFRRETGEEYKLRSLPRKRKTAMAEHTGDPQLDQLIEAYMQRGYATADTRGESIGDDPMMTFDINQLREPANAIGMCSDLAMDFWSFLHTHGVEATLQEATPNAAGYTDRPEHGESAHDWVEVVLPSGTYMVDFTAAQYGYKEFPMVQKLDGDQWQREWSN